MQATRRSARWALPAILLVTAVVYARTLNAGFVCFDDDDYVTDNPPVLHGLTWEGVKWAFTSSHSSNWHPLTWISHMADVNLYGLNPKGHHLTNLLLHLVNVLLVYALFQSIGAPPLATWFAALMFALHPMHVESVAWIAERKDLLCALFVLLSLLSYLRFARSVVSPPMQRSRARKGDLGGCHAQSGQRLESEAAVGEDIPPTPLKRGTCYFASLLAFALALMSKPMAVTLPALLLLLDHWPLQRFGREKTGRLLLEKLPFLLLTVTSCVVTVIAQRAGGAVSSLENIPLPIRAGNAVLAYGEYILRFVWPWPMAVFYPHPGASLSWLLVLVSGSVLAVATVAAVVGVRRYPRVFAGWAWFGIMLAPVMGIVQVGSQALADRYTYLPYLGLAMLLCPVAERIQAKTRLAVVALLALTGVMGAAAWVQLGYWHDSISLFTHAAEVTAPSRIVRYNLGCAYLAAKRFDEAASEFRKALDIVPDNVETITNLGLALSRAGKTGKAIEVYQLALSIAPEHWNAQVNLGVALGEAKRYGEAEFWLRNAVAGNPDDPNAHFNLGLVLYNQGKYADARKELEQTLQLRPSDPDARRLLDSVGKQP